MYIFDIRKNLLFLRNILYYSSTFVTFLILMEQKVYCKSLHKVGTHTLELP